MFRSPVVMQNLTKICLPILDRQMGEVSVFFLTSTQSDRQTINQTISFVSCTDHKYRNMLSIWSSKHVVSRTDVPFGVTTF